MFSIFKKKYSGNIDLSGLATDMHSHLLPGIDDGSPEPAVSEQLIDGLMDLGYRQFICSPHVMWDLYKNDNASIEKALGELRAHLSAAGKQVPLKAAAEYYLDEHFSELLEQKHPLRCLRDKWVLIEFSFVNAPINLKETLFELQLGGYKPVLAHPERYTYLSAQRQLYAELKDAGCLFQVNILSLAGYYGKLSQELAQYLIRNDWVDLVGTDLHHHRHLEALRSAPRIMDPIQRLLDSGRLLNPGLWQD